MCIRDSDAGAASGHNQSMSQTAPVQPHAPPRRLPMPPAFRPEMTPYGWGASGAADVPFDDGDACEQDRRVRESLHALDLRELCQAVARDARERGICFGTADGPQEFRIDPIPRLIDAEQWRELSAGVAQRVRALELFVRDGVVPQRALAGAEHHEPLLAGMGDRVRSWIPVAGLDVVRDSDGVFKVLEDNLRTPSGIAYAVATREVLGDHLQTPSGLRAVSY